MVRTLNHELTIETRNQIYAAGYALVQYVVWYYWTELKETNTSYY